MLSFVKSNILELDEKIYKQTGHCVKPGKCTKSVASSAKSPGSKYDLRKQFSKILTGKNTMNRTNYSIRTETKADFFEVENLTREAFWNVYKPGCEEHFVLHCYRKNLDFIPELSLVLELDKKIIGHVMYSRSHIDSNDGTQIPVMTFGPISIHPDFKRKGFGKILLDYSMEKAKKLGGKCLLICGNIDFYGKSGFVPAITFGIRYADDAESDAPYFLCKELETGFLHGITGSYKDPEGYFVAQKNPDAFEEYEKQFPPKEKLRLPGQIF